MAFGNRCNKSEILAHVIADFDAVQARIGFDQRKIRLPLLQHADHFQRLQRIGFQRFLRPVQIRLESAAAGACRFRDQFYFRAAERIGLIESLVRYRLIGLHDRQRVDPSAQILGLVFQFGLEVAEFLTGTGREQQRERDGGEGLHFFPALTPFAALFWAATSSSSR